MRAQQDGRGRPRARHHSEHAGVGCERRGVPRATLQALFDTILVSPVLTAHPTEVRRKSVLDRENGGRAPARRARPDAADAGGGGGRRQRLVARHPDALADQPAAARHARPSSTKSPNGLSYYDHTFFREAAAALCRPRGRPRGDRSRPGATPSCPPSSAWEAGSAAIATAIRSSTPTCCGRRSRCRASAWSISISTSCICSAPSFRSTAPASACRRSLRNWSGATPTNSPRRASEPYRQADRRHLCAACRHRARTWARTCCRATRWRRRKPYASAAELRADLDVLYRSLFANGSALIARGRLRMLRRAVEVFGFHLASVDLRQNSDVHERVMAELFRDRHGRGLSPDAGSRRASRCCWPSSRPRGR